MKPFVHSRFLLFFILALTISFSKLSWGMNRNSERSHGNHDDRSMRDANHPFTLAEEMDLFFTECINHFDTLTRVPPSTELAEIILNFRQLKNELIRLQPQNSNEYSEEYIRFVENFSIFNQQWLTSLEQNETEFSNRALISALGTFVQTIPSATIGTPTQVQGLLSRIQGAGSILRLLTGEVSR
jgi:hypothetical protein